MHWGRAALGHPIGSLQPHCPKLKAAGLVPCPGVYMESWRPRRKELAQGQATRGREKLGTEPRVLPTVQARNYLCGRHYTFIGKMRKLRPGRAVACPGLPCLRCGQGWRPDPVSAAGPEQRLRPTSPSFFSEMNHFLILWLNV